MKEETSKWILRSRTNVINDEDGSTLTETEEIKKKQKQKQKDVDGIQHKIVWEVEITWNRWHISWILEGSWGEGVDILWCLCTLIWKNREWPKDWCRAVFIPIPKNCNLKDCANYRTTSLISHAIKLMLGIIINRMKKNLKQEISITHAEFREDRGIRNHIVNIRNIIEKCKKHRLPLYRCFIDFLKAVYKTYETRREYGSVVTLGSSHKNMLHFDIYKLP